MESTVLTSCTRIRLVMWFRFFNIHKEAEGDRPPQSFPERKATESMITIIIAAAIYLVCLVSQTFCRHYLVEPTPDLGKDHIILPGAQSPELQSEGQCVTNLGGVRART